MSGFRKGPDICANNTGGTGRTIGLWICSAVISTHACANAMA